MSNLPNYVVETPRILLRYWSEPDLNSLVELNSDPRVMQYFPTTLSPQESLEMMKRIQSHYDDWGFGLWAAVYKETQECMGFVGLNTPRFEAAFTPCVEIGWRLLPKFWNKGLATEGARAALDFGFNNLDLQIIYSWTPIDNKPSERVMQKIGMDYQETFMHPNLPSDDPLCAHVKYTLTRKKYTELSGLDQ